MSHSEEVKKAVALRYDQDQDEAPKVIAKGEGNIAKSIVEIASSNQIPIQKDESLVELLSQVELNEKIPEELYGVVAELFAFIYRLDQEKNK